jgi:hypothetical protein
MLFEQMGRSVFSGYLIPPRTGSYPAWGLVYILFSSCASPGFSRGIDINQHDEAAVAHSGCLLLMTSPHTTILQAATKYGKLVRRNNA